MSDEWEAIDRALQGPNFKQLRILLSDFKGSDKFIKALPICASRGLL